jgi:hypothetical protein
MISLNLVSVSGGGGGGRGRLTESMLRFRFFFRELKPPSSKFTATRRETQ